MIGIFRIVYLNGSSGELFRSLSSGEGKRRRKAVQGKEMYFSYPIYDLSFIQPYKLHSCFPASAGITILLQVH